MVCQHIYSAVCLFVNKGEISLVVSNSFNLRFCRLKPDCILELAEGMRPAEPEPEVFAEEKEEDKKERKSSTSSSSSSSSSSDDEKDEEKKKAKKEKKEQKKKAKAAEAAAVAVTTMEVEAVEEKKEEAEEKKEEAEEKKDELEQKADDTAVVIAGDGGSTVRERVVITEKRSYTHQSSSSGEKDIPKELLGEDTSMFTSTMEGSSSFTTTTRVVTSKQVISSSSTSQRIITSEGMNLEALENGESEKVRLQTMVQGC